MRLEPPGRQDIVIIGATGDLARRKLLPALYNLGTRGLLPEGGSIIGLARSDLSHDGFSELARSALLEFSDKPFDEAR